MQFLFFFVFFTAVCERLQKRGRKGQSHVAPEIVHFVVF